MAVDAQAVKTDCFKNNATSPLLPDHPSRSLVLKIDNEVNVVWQVFRVWAMQEK